MSENKLLNFTALDLKERVAQILTTTDAAEALNMDRQKFLEHCFDVGEKDRSKGKILTFKVGRNRIFFKDVIEKWKSDSPISWSQKELKELRERQKLILTLNTAANEFNMDRRTLESNMYFVGVESADLSSKKWNFPAFKIGNSVFLFRDYLKPDDNLYQFASLDLHQRANLILTLSVAAEELKMTKQSLIEYCFDIDHEEDLYGDIKINRRMPTFKVGETRIIFRDVMERWKANWQQEWTDAEKQELQNRKDLILTLSVAAEELNMSRMLLNQSYIYDIHDDTVSADEKNRKIPSFKVGRKRILFKDYLETWNKKRKGKRKSGR